MIYKDGQLWDGWREDLEKSHGKKFQLKKTAVFRVIDRFSGKKKVDKRLIDVYAQVQIPVEYTWTSSEGIRSRIKYATNADLQTLKGGKETKMVYTPRRIPMKGILYVNQDNVELYWFLINHQMCGTARRFNSAEKPEGVGVRQAQYNLSNYGNDIVFKEVNKDAELQSAVKTDLLITKAKYILYDTVSEKELRNLYAFYGNNNMDENPDQIRLYLKAKIEGRPTDLQFPSGAAEFLSILEDKARVLKGTVAQAAQLGVIEFTKGRVWMFGENPICTVPKLKDTVNYLVEWLKENDVDGLTKAITEGVVEKERNKEPVG